MTLQDIYDQMAYGELGDYFRSGTTIDGGSLSIPSEFYKEYLPFIKTGLTDLHTRFSLRESMFHVELSPPKVSYLLTMAYAQSNARSREAVKWIDDSAEPFKDNLMKVSRISGTWHAAKYEIPLNDIDDLSSILVPNFNTLLVPDDVKEAPWLAETTKLRVTYRADHPAIDVPRANALPAGTQIYLPPTFMDALVMYVASRKLNARGMTPGSMHEGNNYYQRYEATCAMLENRGQGSDTGSQNSRIVRNGWA